MTSGDTIVAFSSTIAPAGRMILRISGPAATAILQTFCDDYTPKPSSVNQQLLNFVNLKCPAWVYTFRSPNSYTGEDLVEIHLPGSPPIAQLLLSEVVKRGARLAEPGEFTARAYFAGKLDLAEAEGVAATIAAGNETELLAARQLLSGELARRLRPAIDLMAETLALLEVGIDFSEEDVSFLPANEIIRRAEEIDASLKTLLEESSQFERLTHEPRIVLIGRPNAGKSTLMNTLTGELRSVVSDIAGTTRDVLSATVDLEHGRVQILDVAGLDDTQSQSDHIEHQMRDRAIAAIESADHVVLVRDGADVLPPIAITREINLVVCTKADLNPSELFERKSGIRVSAINGFGLQRLRDALDQLAFGSDIGSIGLALNRRHVADLETARAALARAVDRVADNAAELIALELREALDALGRILGSVTPDDVLGKIFSSFCIGK